ncbi:hypothetical protein RCO28_28355 [Streptomyces sp. LHD-70]|uniref:hypothetical protein n=1 Tax=Streptomyces sp. LHD-70 TaxID=3072140 RepID=UPI00280F40CA|nr:hypothetical protein [Streptomyces sp. LHD-70]MDQ8706354.1 hypothetical protein [Streptomyces sp. LHD-70]
MSTSPPQPGSAPTATLVRNRSKHVRGAVIYGSCLVAIAVVIAVLCVAAATGVIGERSGPLWLSGLFFSAMLGWPGVHLVRLARKRMRSFIRVDGEGLALHNSRGGRGIIAWADLEAVAVQWSPADEREPSVTSLELCPRGEIDRDAPDLWFLVRDEEPLRPDLQRLRYQISAAKGEFTDTLVAAARQHAPTDLWLGEFERAPGYVGSADHEGHRRRTEQVQAESRSA